MKTITSLVAAGLLTAGTALAGFTATNAGPIESTGPIGDAGNGGFSYVYAGAEFTPGNLTFSGQLTSGGVGSWLSEARWRITNPAGEAVTIQPSTTSSSWTGTQAIGPVTFTGLQTLMTGTSIGSWAFDAYESYNDADLDATWTDVSFEVGDYVPPTPVPWPGGVESFETGVPPTNHPGNTGSWEVVASAGQSGTTTWHQYASGFESESSATVLYDYDQNEWLYTPYATAVGGMTLSGQSMGSLYWGTPVEQGGMYDNYDMNVYIVHADDSTTLVGKLDDTWTDTYLWTAFSYDLDSLLTLGEQFRIGFQYVGNDGAQGSIDAVLLTPEPASLVLLALAGLMIRRR
jgi:hypothetical protein